MNIMLYIHIPFCSARCSYCSFYSLVRSKEDFYNFKNTLIQEITHASLFHYLPTPHTVSSIFFGGGTPSLLPPEYIAEILFTIRTCYVIDSAAEITLEANPESISFEKALLWKEAGISRISMGCQSFQPDMLKLLDRVHSPQDIYRAIAHLHKASFTNITIDLMWGLLHQSTQDWLQELTLAIQLGVQHISTYSLTIEENTTLSRNPQHIPTTHEDTLCQMYTKGIQLLEKYGFHQYEVSNFAQEGYTCAHNMGYWNNTSYHGFGPSASSYIFEDDKKKSYRYTHSHSLTKWTDTITTADNTLSPAHSIQKETITPFTHLRESIMLGLRQKKGFYFPLYEDIMHVPLIASHKNLITHLEKEKLLSCSDTHYSLTTKGFLCSDAIIDAFTRDISIS
ncbi:MAG: radical SAM family heme chaperone HemW [Desulfovibrionaceae bacterium]